MKTNLITDPITGEILQYDKLFLGQRQVVTPAELKNYNYAPMSGVVKGLDGTLVDITKIYQTFGEAKTEGGAGEVPAHNHDSVYSKLEHTHTEYASLEEVYSKTEIDTKLEGVGNSTGGYGYVDAISGSSFPACYATAPTNPFGAELKFECRCIDKDGTYYQIFSKNPSTTYPHFYKRGTTMWLKLNVNSSTTYYAMHKWNEATKTWTAVSTTYFYVQMLNDSSSTILYSNIDIPYSADSDAEFAGKIFSPAVIPQGEPISNFNDAKKAGYYTVEIGDSNILNAPEIANVTGFLEVLESSRSIMQKLTLQDGAVFTRMCINNTWNNWT